MLLGPEHIDLSFKMLLAASDNLDFILKRLQQVDHQLLYTLLKLILLVIGDPPRLHHRFQSPRHIEVDPKLIHIILLLNNILLYLQLSQHHICSSIEHSLL